MLFKIKTPATKQQLFNPEAYKKSAFLINPRTGKPFAKRTVENEGAAMQLAKASTMAMWWPKSELKQMYDNSPKFLISLLNDIGFKENTEIEEIDYINSQGEECIIMLQECDTTKFEELSTQGV
jgi:hypothetical protein